jgi:glycosyltransferase involved in cell wall biosynthesis
MEDELFFSIVIPVYNVQDYLNECIESVLEQNYNNYEMILIDDGSTDNSGRICDSFIEKSNNIRVIHQTNKGLSGARNTGIRSAKGKYLVYLDSDDMLCPDSLKNLEMQIINQHEPQIIISRRKTYNPKYESIKECEYYFNLNTLKYKKNYEIWSELQKMKDMWMGVWIFSTKKDYVLENNLFFYKGILHEDEEWVPRLIMNTNNIGFNNYCLYCNRINRVGSITESKNIKKEFDSIKIVGLLQEEFLNNDIYEPEIKDAVLNRIQAILFGTISRASVYRNDVEYKNLVKQINSKIELLKNAKRKIYVIEYQMCKIFGVKFTGVIFGCLVKFKNVISK